MLKMNRIFIIVILLSSLSNCFSQIRNLEVFSSNENYPFAIEFEYYESNGVVEDSTFKNIFWFHSDGKLEKVIIGVDLVTYPAYLQKTNDFLQSRFYYKCYFQFEEFGNSCQVLTYNLD